MTDPKISAAAEQYRTLVQTEVGRYLNDGFAPIPLIPATSSAKGENGKTPREKEWQDSKGLAPQDWGLMNGIGLNLGNIGISRKGHLICVDLDAMRAVELGDLFLPETDMIGGRSKKPKSNRFYVISNPEAIKHIVFKNDEGTIVEILGKGHQVVVAPTIVIGKDDDRDTKIWYSYGGLEGPTSYTWEEILDKVTKLVVVSELKRIWPTEPGHGRHRLSLHLAGGLLRAGWTVEGVVYTVDHLLGWSTQEFQEGELERAVRDTWTKLENGERRVTGWPAFMDERGGDEKVKDSIRRVIAWLKAEEDERPPIMYKPGTLDKMVDKAWAILQKSNDPANLFRFSNKPVRIDRIDDRDMHQITPLTGDSLRYMVSREMAWFKTSSKEIRIPLDPPIEVIKTMLSMGDIPLPILNRIVTAPVFSPRGILQTTPGYHYDSRTYYAPSTGVSIPEVHEKPSAGQVERARSLLLDDLFVDFPMERDSDLAHAVALCLLPFVRDMVDGATPLHIINASTQASGKTLLAKTVSSIFVGRGGAVPTAWPSAEEEMVKLLLSRLLEGAQYINFDNVTGRMASAAAALAITGMFFNARRLGASESLSPPVRCVWMATSNNATGDGDIIRRSVEVRLVPQVEHPHLIPIDRWKHFPLDEWVYENRGDLIWACLTLCQHWIAEGAVRSSKSFGDFGAWAGVMGGLLDSIGIEGFLEDVVEFQMIANQEKQSWAVFYEEMWTRHGPGKWTAGEAVNVAQISGLEFRDKMPEQQKRELGRLLATKKDVIHGGLRLELHIEQGRRGAANVYTLVPIDDRTWEGPPIPPTINKGDNDDFIILPFALPQ